MGYAALIAAHELALPLPPRLAAIAERHHPVATSTWNMLTPRHRPDSTLAAQLTFAIKWEGIDLSVLAQLFSVLAPDVIAGLVRDTPTGAFARRIWFVYEWMTGDRLDLSDAGKVRLVEAVDPTQQFALANGEVSARHRVLNNLPGTPRFCPMVRRSRALVDAAAKNLDERARMRIGRVRPDLIARAAAFLMLNDSKSSFAIEGERPSSTRVIRWGQAIAEAGHTRLSLSEFDRLQRIVIGDARFVKLGLRDEGGFVGVHDRETGDPIPDHISARPQDLEDLLTGLVDYAARTLKGGYDPVVASAALAFGFVYIHPYVDGNGRLHRWLIHHVLAAASYNPPDWSFPLAPRFCATSTPIGPFSKLIPGLSCRRSTGAERRAGTSTC
ncbi:Fic family protein [Mesorhizobium sp. ORM6]